MVPSSVNSASVLSDRRMGAPALPLGFSLWSQDGGHKSRHSMFKRRTDEEKFLKGLSLITQENSLPEASVRRALTFHWPEPGHLPTYKPMAGKRE